jgi:hypothetical protein
MSSEMFENIGDARRSIRAGIGRDDLTAALKCLTAHKVITTQEYQRCAQQAELARQRGQDIAQLARNLQNLYAAGRGAIEAQIDRLPPTEGGGVRGITAHAKLAAQVAEKLEAIEDEYHMLVAAILTTTMHGDDY